MSTDAAVWFFHGLGDWSNTWAAAHRRPELSGITVVTPDLPGCGRRPPSGERLEELAAHFIQEVSAAGHERVVLVGHSLGGVLATLIAENEPPWLAGIADIEGCIAVDERVISKRIVATHDFDAWMSGFMDSIYRQGLDRQEMRSYHAGLMMCDRPTMIRQAEDLVRLRTANAMGHRFGRLPVPRLFCYGNAAHSDQADLLMREYHFDRHEFDGAGHWLMAQKPDEFFSVVGTWVKQLL